MAVTERCPRCGSRNVRGGKITLPGKGDDTDTVVHERYCDYCGLHDEVTTAQPDWQEVLERWEQQEGSPRTLDVYWSGNPRSGFSTIVHTAVGKQSWRLAISEGEPRYTLLINGHEADRLRSDEWPAGWGFTTSREKPHTSHAGRAMQFELLGTDADDVRLLRASRVDYSIALAGHPRLAPHPDGPATYDVVLALGDLAVYHGFRIDGLPAETEPQALAEALVTSYRSERAIDNEARIKKLPVRPPWMLGGAEVIYGRRDVATPTMEQVWVMIRAAPSGYWALFHTTWFRNADVNNLRWAHLRGSFIDQHAWDGKPRDTSPEIWPPSTISLPSAKLDLTADALKEVAAKAASIGHMTTQQVLGMAGILRGFAQEPFPPRAPVPELVLDTVRMRLTEHGPPQAAAVLLRNVEQCKTRHDLRGWAWQCILAMGNRAELEDRIVT